MNMGKGWTLSARIGAGFAAVIVLGLGVALYAWVSLHDLQSRIEVITEERMSTIDLLADTKDHINLSALAMRNMVLADDKATRAADKRAVDEVRAKVLADFDKLKTALHDEKGKALMASVLEARAPFIAASDKVITAALADEADTAKALLSRQVAPAQTAYFKALDALIAHEQKLAHTTGDEARDVVTRAGWVLGGIGLAALLAGAGVAWVIQRLVMRQVGGEPAAVVSVANAIAAGDLSVPVPLRSGDRESILAAMATMRERLSDVVGQVRAASDTIATGSAQIATGNADLSQRTEEQACNLQQTAASMEQLTGTVKANADTATQADQLAGEASAAAARGGERMGQVVSTMNEIAASSRRIADIIGVIDGIAFQTNILSLNAAVEAARAGEQGRGFAVVAGEVRSLAQRAAEAAREIKSLIGTSVERVEAGARQVDEAGASMQDLVDQVCRVSQLIGVITNATREQAGGIGQVGDAVSQLDKVTQQNAALVEQSAAAAESLHLQAERLRRVVSMFKVDERAQPAA